MVNVALIIGVTIGLSIVGGGIGYLIYLALRPKKMSWKAKVYQLSEGVKPPKKDKMGRIVADFDLRDLRPYANDTIVREEKATGNVIYRLVKLGKTVPMVTSDVVDYWGDKNKEVSVLLEGDSCTLLKKGYSNKSGVIFEPMPNDRVNMIKTEMEIVRERTKAQKHLLERLSPFIVVGIAMLSLVAIFYFGIQGAVEISENLKDVGDTVAKAQLEAANTYRDAVRGDFGADIIAKQEDAPTITP